MSTHDDDFIAMPPGGDPTPPALPAPEPEPQGAGFISLPPGVVAESGTYRLPPRPQTPARTLDDVVFVPTALGAAAPPAAPPAAPAAPPAPPAEASAPVTTPTAIPVAIPRATAPELPVEITTEAVASWSLELPQRAGTVLLDGTLLVGRNPGASADWPGAGLLALADSTRSVSKSHAVLRVEGRELWVHDLGSTNGVFIVDGGRPAVEVVPGVPQRVPSGADLELGDYVIRVVRA